MVWRTKFTLIGPKEVGGVREKHKMTIFTAVLMVGLACSLQLLITVSQSTRSFVVSRQGLLAYLSTQAKEGHLRSVLQGRESVHMKRPDVTVSGVGGSTVRHQKLEGYHGPVPFTTTEG